MSNTGSMKVGFGVMNVKMASSRWVIKAFFDQTNLKCVGLLMNLQFGSGKISIGLLE